MIFLPLFLMDTYCLHVIVDIDTMILVRYTSRTIIMSLSMYVVRNVTGMSKIAVF